MSKISREGSPVESSNQPVDNPEILEILPQLFVNDFLQLREVNSGVMQRLFKTPPPEESVINTNADKSVFSLFLNAFQVLRSEGYGIYFSDNAVMLSGEEIPSLLRVSALPEDISAIGLVISQIISNKDENPYLNLANAIGMNYMSINFNTLLESHPYHSKLVSMISGIADTEIETVLSRGYLTYTLCSFIELSNSYNGLKNHLYRQYIDDSLIKDAKLYEKIRESGLRPYSPEECLGMVAEPIRQILKDNPDIQKPFSKRTQ